MSAHFLKLGLKLFRAAALFGLGVVTTLPVQAAPTPAGGRSSESEDRRHVLLISVDGLHELDVQQFIAAHPDSTFAKLVHGGTSYTNASSSMPSDSFPGLLAMVTGGTPKTTGVFYDDAYSRTFWAPDKSTCSGAAGTETLYAENLDKLDAQGNIPLVPLGIDPANLPNAMVDGKCQRVYPHSFLQTNTIFNVAHDAGLYTAWSDKHPAYEIVRGPANTGAEDLYTPEINNVNDPTAISVAATDAYDQLKVRAVLNEIDGRTSDGSRKAPVPAIFGMNFQSVSVGEKLVDPVKSCARNKGSNPACDPNYFPGGYQPGTLKFTPQMELAMTYVDGALGAMVDELREQGLWNSTEMIVSAKHGQSPIDPSTLHKVGDPLSKIITDAGATIGQITTDDIALVWLTDQSKTAAAVAALNSNKSAARIQSVLAGDALADKFGDPLHNSRTPDLIVQPIPGTIYTGSKAKVAEHGGFAADDTHVALIVAGGATNAGQDDRAPANSDDGASSSRTVHVPVRTAQIAPTILRFLGLDPHALKSVRLEGTELLPG